MMGYWRIFCTTMLNRDPDQIWLDLCLGKEDAIQACQSFLRFYVKDSMRNVLILGPKEYEWRREVNTTSSVIAAWRTLLGEADSTVLQSKRREDPGNARRWQLQFCKPQERNNYTPTARISRWVLKTLRPELGLTYSNDYDKIEFTATDVVLALTTLWLRADVIPAKPVKRISFHAIILLAALGGFRRSSIMRIRYQDIQVAIVRDPTDRSKRKLVATLRVRRTKVRAALQATRSTSLSFSITIIPKSVLCLTSLIVARAIKDNAFEAGYRSVEELFSKPSLGTVDYLALSWKESVAEKPIFALKSEYLDKYWKQTCLAIGLREDPRLYAMRVGSGARLDGVLSDSLRNYIISNTSAVFQNSYQTHHVREDLTRLAFGSMAERNDELFSRLRDISLSRDADAPVCPTKEELQAFEARRDVSGLRAALKTARGTYAYSKVPPLEAKIYRIIAKLSELVVRQNRIAYFKKVDLLRAQGLPTTHLVEQHDASRLQKSGAFEVACSLQSLDQNLQTDCQLRSPWLYMEALVRYHSDIQPIELYDRLAEHCDRGHMGDNRLSDHTIARDRYKCFLCKATYKAKQKLSTHFTRLHVKSCRTFDQHFSCPACPEGDVLITSSSAWSNHVATKHGERHAPMDLTLNQELCLLCERHYNRVLTHETRTHDKIEGTFKQPFRCPACFRQKHVDVWIDGRAAWHAHVASVHSMPTQSSLHLQPNGSAQKDIGMRKRERDSSSPAANIDPQLLSEEYWNGPKRLRTG